MSIRPGSVVAPPVKHHYIPKFYQHGFIRDKSNSIWVYEKGREPRQLSIRKTGMKYNESKTELRKIRDQYSREVPDFIFPTNTLRESMFEAGDLFHGLGFLQSESRDGVSNM